MFKTKAKLINWKVLKTRVNLIFASSDITESDLMELIQLKGADGHLLFNIDEIKKEIEEIVKDKTIAVDPKGLSPSQKLRKEIWINWNESETKKPFDQYYFEIIEYFINLLKYKRFKNRYANS